METKRQVMESIAMDYLQVCQITDFSDVESALGRIMERYDNAPCDCDKSDWASAALAWCKSVDKSNKEIDK